MSPMHAEPFNPLSNIDELPIGKRYQVGDHRLMLHRAGSGTPAVVIEAGAGMFGLDYIGIQQPISQDTTCVIYDRLGLGWSDPVGPQPRTATQVADDLHTLLRVADVPGPYVLVCHSLGGFFTRRYAQRYPEDVAGLVFIDPAHEDIPVSGELEQVPEVLAQMLEQLRQNPDGLRHVFPHLFTEAIGWPDGIREALVDRHLQPGPALAGVKERTSMARLYDEFRGSTLPDVPAAVITGVAIDENSAWMTPQSQRQIVTTMRAAHASLANSLPRGSHIILEDAGHMIQAERPDAIVDAIRKVIAATRTA